MKIKIGLLIKVIIVLIILSSCGVQESVEYKGRSYDNPSTYSVEEFNQKYGKVEPIGDKKMVWR